MSPRCGSSTRRTGASTPGCSWRASCSAWTASPCRTRKPRPTRLPPRCGSCAAARPGDPAHRDAPQRADPRDALVGVASLDELPPGARVGTSSLRRMAQLRAAREDLEVVELRGNVDTRLRKLAEGECDALLLAAAGLERLGRGGEIGTTLPCGVFVPAPGQGSLAVEARAADAEELAAIDHPPSHDRLRGE